MSTAAHSRSSQRSIALYVHIPYCLEKCPYCDFNSYGIDERASGRKAELQEEQYCRALLKELSHYGSQSAWQQRDCHSIFFGGGTPSLFSVQSIEAILKAIGRTFSVKENAEITLEANPGTISERLGHEKLHGFREAGVNRISLGAQSFQPEKLKTLGRWHSASDTHESVENIRKAGFSNFNLDLMFGVPGETESDWQSDLHTAIELRPTHIASYGLTIEPGTEFAIRVRKGVMQAPDDGIQANFYREAQRTLDSAGYAQYEISNFASPTHQCRHNLSYWCWEEYLGLGAGAHSFLKLGHNKAGSEPVAQRWSNIPKPSHYISRAELQGDCSQRREDIDRKLAENEFLLCGLRTKCGIAAEAYADNFQSSLFEQYAQVIDLLVKENMLLLDQGNVSLTEKGFLFADSVLAEFAR